jgi:hypothetical protein
MMMVVVFIHNCLLLLPIISVHSLVPSTKSSAINKMGAFSRSLLQLYSSQPTSLPVDQMSKEHTTQKTYDDQNTKSFGNDNTNFNNNNQHMHFTGKHYSNENIKIPSRNYNNDVNHTLDHNWRQAG